jgi:hypothetical protein
MRYFETNTTITFILESMIKYLEVLKKENISLDQAIYELYKQKERIENPEWSKEK